MKRIKMFYFFNLNVWGFFLGKFWFDVLYRIMVVWNVGELVGYRIYFGGGWMLILGIFLLISSSF